MLKITVKTKDEQNQLVLNVTKPLEEYVPELIAMFILKHDAIRVATTIEYEGEFPENVPKIDIERAITFARYKFHTTGYPTSKMTNTISSGNNI